MTNKSTVSSENVPPLSVSGLRKSFNGSEVLRSIDVEAKRGDVISVLGSSGSGKSTFLRCLNLLEIPDGGSIEIAGEALPLVYGSKGGQVRDRRRLQQIRTKIGMVFQAFNLWPHRTIIDNLTLAPTLGEGLTKKEATERAVKYLDRVGIGDKRNNYPGQLSGGQQQRAAIARALCMEPEIILFDEPTSSLDPELVGEVLQVIRMLADEGRTMIVVSHEMAFARDVSSRVLFFRNGVIEEDGEPNEVFNNPASEAFRRFIMA